MDQRRVDVLVDRGRAARTFIDIGDRQVTLIRIRLVALAFVVLACQAAAFSAAPIALHCGALSADADLDECCRNMSDASHDAWHAGASRLRMDLPLQPVRRRARFARRRFRRFAGPDPHGRSAGANRDGRDAVVDATGISTASELSASSHLERLESRVVRGPKGRGSNR
jgi:hypothetical protein